MAYATRQDILLTDDEIEAAFDALGYGLSASEDDEDLSYGTADEIDEFRRARKAWQTPGRVTLDTPDTFVVEGARAAKHQQRRDIAIVRFGDYCAIMGMDR